MNEISATDAVFSCGTDLLCRRLNIVGQLKEGSVKSEFVLL